ncbi:MAG: hypothetical protein Q9166_001947 [cf. Caloplaca sp. 2 TL-2023]
MHLIPVHRSFGAFLVLLVSAILLSTWNHGSATRYLAKRRPLNENTLFPGIPSSATATIATQLFGVHDYQLNLSDTHLSHVINKRARTLTYKNAACAGRKLYYEVIQNAFSGKGTSAKDYGENDIKNGWTRETLFRSIPSGFEEAFKMIGKNIFPNIGERIPSLEETFGINLVQDQNFVNSAGKKQKAIPIKDNHRAHYECYYIPLWHAIISSDARSPKYMLRDLKLKPADLDKRVPPLNRQSDVMWTVYKTVAQFPNDLRFIGRDSIINDDTRGIMNDVFAKGPTGKPVTWPGVSFDIETEEAQALLGTPNGLATAYILADRAKDLGKRRISVRIWASYTDPPNQGYRMLWNMEPPVFGPEPSALPPSLPPLPEFPPLTTTKRGFVGGTMVVTETMRPLQTF